MCFMSKPACSGSPGREENRHRQTEREMIRRISITAVLLLSALLPAMAQIRAVTGEGDEVILYTNGTWEYVTMPEDEAVEIMTNPTPFSRETSASFLVKSKKVNLGVWINPRVWSFEKGGDEDAAEYTFQKKGEDVYAMLITERTMIPLMTLRGIALENARSAAPDITLLSEEYRTVNGKQMLMLQMAGTIQGLEFIYYGYYYSDENGTVQFVAYCGRNLFDEYIKDMESILNGLVVTE